MDVRAWLQNTADREPPDEEDRAAFPGYLRPERYTTEDHIRTHQGKRQRASSEPRPLVRRTSQGRHGGHKRAAASESSSDHIRSVHAGTASTRSLSSGERSRPSPDRRFNKTFERRARYKTRADRYEPNAKKRRKHEHDSRKDDKTRPKRRKSHRSGDGARTAGLVTSFQLKEKPKNSRLTLRPADVSAGIFKHGRAGAPIAGRGSGLPDLVFNEMRFLRRPREHQDEMLADHIPQQQGDNADKRKRPEGGISAYFAKPNTGELRSHGAQRPLPELGSNPGHNAQGLQEEGNETRHLAGHRDADSGEPPANASLRVGSSGPNQGVRNANRTSNSFYTWSESVPAIRSPARHADPRTREKTPVATAQSHVSKDVQPVTLPNGSVKRLIRRQRAADPSGRWLQSSLSLPQSVVDAAHVLRDGKSPQPMHDRFPTSDILRFRHESQLNGDRSSSHLHDKLSDRFSGKENQDLSTSTPTSQLLRHAFRAIKGPLEDQAQPSKNVVRHGGHTFAKAEHHPGFVPEQQRLTMPERGFSRSTDASHVIQRNPAARPLTRAIGFVPTTTVLPRSSHQLLTGYDIAADDEMLDSLPIYCRVEHGRPYTFTNGRQADELARRLACSTRDGFRLLVAPQEHYLRTPSKGLGDFSALNVGVEEAEQPQTRSEAQNLPTEHSYAQTWSNHDAPDPGGGEVQHDAMPGFWRPNKLY